MRGRVEQGVASEIVAAAMEATRRSAGATSQVGGTVRASDARGRCADDAGADNDSVLGRNVQAACRARQRGHG